MCINYFAKKHGIHFDKKRGYSRVGEGIVDGVAVVLIRPQTFMNASGIAVKALLNKTKANIDDLIVIHDDLDLAVGRIKIRKGGSSGGHNGIKSIIGMIGTEEFIRIRIGIGRPYIDNNFPAQENSVINFVLGDFTEEENKLIQPVILRVTDVIEHLINVGLDQTMNDFNSQKG
jgi:PTH1 family peptidyl-tRNA hydrolase